MMAAGINTDRLAVIPEGVLSATGADVSPPLTWRDYSSERRKASPIPRRQGHPAWGAF